ncbi:MAG: bifunctional alpha,alpha-trehalose-phosphate synthase (UDP-forming)/trehalose-phosphatase [Armatimonadota bacterium]|nr:bifunctional alpha,alpha-trehalose-phosphate synthase (UDP-forming)/trehalose-phosphatase [Armatimonadota bacterium]
MTAPPDGRIAQVQGTMRELLGSRHLVVVSNREPYVHRRASRSLEVERPAGGLVAALDPVMQATRGVWVAWGSGEADFEVTDSRDCVQVPPDAPAYTLRRVRLSRDEVERYYHGYANQALWPLFHLAVDKARFGRRAWAAYQEVNRRFALAARDMVTADALVWIQDYHLALCARYLRHEVPEAFLMHFWHIPWPSWDVFRICPQAADLLEGLLANDLVAFHVQRHVDNFLDCAKHELGADVDAAEGVVEYGGRYTKVQALPISIDVEAWETVASSRDCERWMDRLRTRFRLRDRWIGVGVDRLDYTKGIPERLRAIERLFQRHPELRDRFVFIQKSSPSRTRIKAYRDLQDQVEAGIERINAQYGTETWRPIIYIPQPLPPAGMAALYRMADCCIVSSLQDGMNLVAKEFVAAQVDARGVLILSQLAGVSDQVPWAVTINPFDTDGMVEAFVRALRMPAAERRERMDQMRAHVRQHDIFHWMEQHMRAAAHLLAGRMATRFALDHLQEIRGLADARECLAVLVDFDGTLAPIADRPDDVNLPPRARSILTRLARRPGCHVAVISGRAVDDLQRRVGLPDLIYVGNHGFEIAAPGWAAERRDASEVRELIAVCTAGLRQQLRGIRGAAVENKGVTASVHYRLVRREQIETVRQIVLREVAKLPPGRIEVRRGKMVLELRPAIDWDKGRAAVWLLEQLVGRDWRERCAVLYAGDDRTDEDAFLALGESAVTIRVGLGPHPTAARYMAHSIEEFIDVLQALLERRTPAALPIRRAGPR